MRLTPIRIATLIACIAASSNANTQDETPMMVKSQSGISLDEIEAPVVCSPTSMAVGGDDVLSYRQAGGHLKGEPQFSTEYDSATYHFVSQENVDALMRNPTHYLPAYSGYCAITLALGRVTCPMYTNFKIENDQLLLFELTGFTNGRTLWNSDPTTFKKQADANFEQLSAQK